jgi:hypothetical protein
MDHQSKTNKSSRLVLRTDLKQSVLISNKDCSLLIFQNLK